MTKCDRIAKCAFFNDQLDQTPNMSDYLKRKYCMGEPGDCARLLVASELGPESVPTDLFPGDKPRASSLIARR